MDRLLYSRKEAAAQLSVCLSTLDQLVARGELKVRRIGARILVPRKELERLVGRDVPALWPAKPCKGPITGGAA
jgi:excisionase family DNA binding protein